MQAFGLHSQVFQVDWEDHYDSNAKYIPFSSYSFPLYKGLGSDYFAVPLTKAITQMAADFKVFWWVNNGLVHNSFT